jgi:chemotaxis protein MotB
MDLRSWVAPYVCVLALACRSENVDPAQTNAELGRVTQQLSEEHAEQVSCNNLLSNLSNNLDATREELALVKSQREELAQRRLAFEKLKLALQPLIDSGQAVPVTSGSQMSFNLSAAVLFASGGANVSAEGQQALEPVAKVLAEFPDLHFMIAGHTDAQLLVKGKFADNWELSTQRALQVVRVLVAQGASDKHLAIAGYGATAPADANETPEGRAHNRRIEIVLVPGAAAMPPPEAAGSGDASVAPPSPTDAAAPPSDGAP